MSVDLSTILAVVSIALAGDYLTETWSIGGSYPSTLGLLGTPQGIIGTHNRYEGDASIVRGDAYLHDGNVGVFEMHKWENLYQLAGDSLTHNAAAAQMSYTARYSEMNNPYYFSVSVTDPNNVAIYADNIRLHSLVLWHQMLTTLSSTSCPTTAKKYRAELSPVRH